MQPFVCTSSNRNLSPKGLVLFTRTPRKLTFLCFSWPWTCSSSNFKHISDRCWAHSLCTPTLSVVQGVRRPVRRLRLKAVRCARGRASKSALLKSHLNLQERSNALLSFLLSSLRCAHARTLLGVLRPRSWGKKHRRVCRRIMPKAFGCQP